MQVHAQKAKATEQASAGAKKSLRKQEQSEVREVAEPVGVTAARGFDFGQIAVYPATLYRAASGVAPAVAPPIVDEVLQSPGRPIPGRVRREMERRLGSDFADVRVHTDSRAGDSAVAVAAQAYTVGRHIVFAPGRFEPESMAGGQLLAHELVHAAGHPSGRPTPSGALPISSPADTAERHAVSVAQGSKAPDAMPPTPAILHRQGATPVPIAGVTLNHDRVTVPPETGLSFSAAADPKNATGVAFAMVGDTAAVAGTTISSAGKITVAAGQAGGTAHVHATQTIPVANATPSVANVDSPVFNFIAVPTGIASTTAVAGSVSGSYGGDFTHTFSAPGGSTSAIEFAHVNEKFDASSTSPMVLAAPFGNVKVKINKPDSATDGWDLDASGVMSAVDNVGWDNTFDARPFVANASNPKPKLPLPQPVTAVQNYRNLSLPGQKYGAATIASVTHRRAFEERNNKIVAVTSANKELVEPYMGPTIFRRARAAPASLPAAPAAAAPPAGGAPAAQPAAPKTSTISVDAEGQSATPNFTFNGADLGCKVDSAGVLTPGTSVGTVTVRGGDKVNFDEVTVSLTAAPVAAPANPAPANPAPSNPKP